MNEIRLDKMKWDERLKNGRDGLVIVAEEPYNEASVMISPECISQLIIKTRNKEIHTSKLPVTFLRRKSIIMKAI